MLGSSTGGQGLHWWTLEAGADSSGHCGCAVPRTCGRSPGTPPQPCTGPLLGALTGTQAEHVRSCKAPRCIKPVTHTSLFWGFVNRIQRSRSPPPPLQIIIRALILTIACVCNHTCTTQHTPKCSRNHDANTITVAISWVGWVGKLKDEPSGSAGSNCLKEARLGLIVIITIRPPSSTHAAASVFGCGD